MSVSGDLGQRNSITLYIDDMTEQRPTSRGQIDTIILPSVDMAKQRPLLEKCVVFCETAIYSSSAGPRS